MRLGLGLGLSRGSGSGGGPTPIVPDYASAVFLGDSITFGVGASVTANRWTSLLSTELGATELNQGITGTVLQNSFDSGGAPRVDNGRNRFIGAMLGLNKKAAAFIAYGFNDARYTLATGTFNAAEYKADYREVLNALIINGYSKADIYVGTPYYITDTGLVTGGAGFTGKSRAGFEEYVTAAIEVATDYGVKLCDLYSWLRDNGYGPTTSGDNLHPSDTGHALIKQCWMEQTVISNTADAPTVTSSASGSTVTVSATAVSGAVSYEYELIASNAIYASNTTGSFTSVPNGAYRAIARAVFAGSNGPWAFATADVDVNQTTTGKTEAYGGITDGTALTATSPVLGAWVDNTAQTGAAVISKDQAQGTVAGALSLCHLDSEALGNGVFCEMDLFIRTNNGNSAAVIVRGATAANTNIMVIYNGTNIRILKCIAGTTTQLGSTHAVVLPVGSTNRIRLEAATGAQRAYLNGTQIITATEADAGMAGLGTNMGLRLQSGSWANTIGPAVLATSCGTLP